MSNCKQVSQNIEAAIKQSDKVQCDLKKALEKANDMLKQSKERAKKELLDSLEDHYKSTLDRFSSIDSETRREIDADKRNLTNLQAKLTNVMKLANQVVNGSKNDVASNYSSMAEALQNLQDAHVKFVEDDVGNVQFIATVEKQIIKPLGKIRLKRGTLEILTGSKSSSRGVAAGLDGVIAVADSDNAEVRVYQDDGDFKFVLDTNHELRQGEKSYPWDVVISSSGRFFVTDGTAFVKIFSSDGKYLNQFPTRFPDGKLSDADKSALCGLVIDKEGNLLVGSSNYYISKHKQDGTAIASIKTDIHPWFLAVTSHGRLLVSSASSSLGILAIQLLDHTGHLLHTINASYSQYTEIKTWNPEGVCCSPDEDIIY